MTRQVDLDYVNRSFSAPEKVRHYSALSEKVVLWASEAVIFQRHLPKPGPILDVGCGAGRVTFGLYRLGFQNVQGMDLSDSMIEAASKIAVRLAYPIPFRVANALCLPYDDESFAAAVFAFNGVMQIPSRAQRLTALSEIRRTLKPGGVFVFTTHDRNTGGRGERWRLEADLWREGKQDPRLHELGDVFFDLEGVEGFIHIPERSEMLAAIDAAGLEPIEDLWRPDICDESAEVNAFSNDCRFWVVRRPSND